MYESFYGLTEKPFTLLPDPDYLYLSPKHQRALTLLEYGMMNHAGFSVICGDTGAGKTTLIRRLLTELGDDTKVGLITNTHHSFGELLNWVLMAFGLDGDGKSKAQMHQMFIEFLIDQYAQNMHTVLIVDEAQNMSAETLEELRMLSNINADKDQVLQVILAGQPALRETLRKPELMQFAQRIAVDYYLESLSSHETRSYIHHRLSVAGAKEAIFTDSACDAIYKYSGGTPRLINLLADTSLVYGFAEQNAIINEQIIHDVVREQHSNSIIPTFNTNFSSYEEQSSDTDNEKKVLEKQKEFEQKVNEQSIAYKKAEENQDITERIIERSVENNNAEEITAGLNEHNMHHVTNVANRSDQTVPVMVSGNPGVKDTTTEFKAASFENLSDQATETKDDSNVTPIKAKQAEENKPFENANKEIHDSESKDKEVINPSTNSAEKQRINAESTKNNSDYVEPLMPEKNRRDEDVYPIVHIEENPGKGLNMILIGVVTGMFVASVIMMIAAWMMFGSKGFNVQQEVQPVISQEVLPSVNDRELKALEKERDAAIAVTHALERERDAALKSAKAQEEIRAAELRAAEILADQQRRAEKRLQQARARTRAAEKAEAKARENEHQLKLQTERRETELETTRLNMLRQERERLEAIAREERLASERLRAEQAAELNKPVVKEVKEIEEVEVTTKVNAKPKGKESFSANPCNSPSAKFLSTCKK